MGMVGRIGNDVTLVVTSAADVDSKWNDEGTTTSSNNKRTISDQQFKVEQAYGVWNMNDQFYAFAGKKDLAFGDFSSVNYLSSDLGYRPSAVNSIGVGSDTLVDGLTVVATVYNTSGNAFSDSALGGTGMQNWALNTSYSGLTDGLSVGAGFANHFSQKADGKKVGVMTANFNYALPDTDFAFSGNYSQEDKKSSSNPDKQSAWNLGGAYSNIADTGVNAALSYSASDNGSGAAGNKDTQWVLSSSYALNAHANVGVELAQKKNNATTEKKWNAFTFDLTAWF